MLDIESDISQSIFDALNLGIVVLDENCRVVGWNNWLANASGLSKEQVFGRRLEDIFPDAIDPSLTSAISEALEYGAARLLTHSLHKRLLPLRTRSGEEVVHDISIQSVRPKPGAKCLVQIVDITVQAHKERAFRQRQNARYDAVVDTALDAILMADVRGVIQMANPAAAQAFGYTSSELIGENISTLMGDQDAWHSTWDAILRGNSVPAHSEIPMRRKDGGLTYMEVSASRWFSDSRLFVTTILHDVSERRAAEEALRSLNQTLELRVAERTADRDRMWRLSTDVMLVAQLDGTINAINPAWTDLFGWKETEVVGRNVLDFVLAEHHDIFRSVLESFQSASSARLFEVSLQTRDGDARAIEWSAVASNGLLHGVGRDVTAERQNERALEEAEEALRQAQKNGSHRSAHRRHCPRLQQSFDRHHWGDARTEAPDRCRPLRRHAAVHGCRGNVSQSRCGSHPPAAGLREEAAARPQTHRRQPTGARH
jgi:PAS domain S-box-containing protein